MMIVASKRVTKEVDGGTVEDVKALLQEGYRIDAVDDRECVGVCEGCGVPICINDVYGTTEDDCKLCEACMPEMPKMEPAVKAEEAVSEDVEDICTTCGRLGARCAIFPDRPCKKCDVWEPKKTEEKT